MVKLINPFFSESSRGKFSGCVYQTSKYGQIVRTDVPQRYKPTDLQRLQNYYFGEAADSWRVLTDEQKTEYNQKASKLKMTGFNLYIKENILHAGTYGVGKYGVSKYG